MQMVRVCVCHEYADVRHMDMFSLCNFLSFPAQIRFLVVTDLPLPPHSVTSRQHSMQCLIQLPMALYVVLYLWTVMRRAGAENSDMMIFSGGTLPESRLFK